MINMLQAAKAAKSEISSLNTQQKNDALNAMADSLIACSEEILKANLQDIQRATNISNVMIDRLRLSQERIDGMAKGIRQVAALEDPVGRVLDDYTRADGLNIRKISVPIGVIAIIYESRPNVTSDAAALALKSGTGNRCGLPATSALQYLGILGITAAEFGTRIFPSFPAQ